MDYPDYDPALDTPPLDDAELEALDDLLAGLPGETALNAEALDGYLTALAVGPVPVVGRRSAEWLPRLWGGDPAPADPAAPAAPFAPFTSGKQKKRAVLLALRHLHALRRSLAQLAAGDAMAWEPVVSVAETDDDELVDAEDWCAGFLEAVALDAAAWAAWFDDAELGPLLLPVALLGGDADALAPADRERLADPLERDALSRAALDAVPRLWARGAGAAGPADRPTSG